VDLAQALVKLLQPKRAMELETAVSPINPTEERVKRLLNPGGSSPDLLVIRRQSLATLGLTAGTGLMAIVPTQNTYFAKGSWFDRLTTNGSDPFALSLSKGGHCKEGLMIMH
jgi:hypothetical protein